MNNLSFKVVVTGLILGAAFLALSPFTPDSTADTYVLVTTYIEECWDDSRVPDSLAVLCSSTMTGFTISLMSANHDPGIHDSSRVVVKTVINKKSTFSCYVGCSSS